MKALMIFSILFLLFENQVFAEKSLSNSMDKLGVNRDVVRKARLLNPKNKVKVVQKRAVDRTLRLETSLGYGFISGGNPYLSSKTLEGSVDFHLNPRWSLGLGYHLYNNSLSSEGERIFDENGTQGVAPDVRDYAKNSYLFSVSYYPIYGKVNLFNWNVTQFDVYLNAGYGAVNLDLSGNSSLASIAGGLGFWITNGLSTRFEIRYQTYQDTVGEGTTRNLNQTVFLAKIGFLL